MQPPRPVFLDLTRIRLPVTALTSIFHRIAGLAMILVLPVLIYLFEMSLDGPAGFFHARMLLTHPVLKVLFTVLGFALAHHLLAGVRVLLLDLDIGLVREAARRSAMWVNILGLVLGGLWAWGIWSCAG